MCPKKSKRLFSCQFYIVYLTRQNHSLRLVTKIKVYRAVVIPTLLYGAETWTLYRRQVRLLERFHQRCLRSILNIKWHDYVSNEDVLEEAQLPSIESILLPAAAALGGTRRKNGGLSHAKSCSFR